MSIDSRHYPLLAAICASLFSTPLMAAGVNAILPDLGEALGAGAIQLSLVGGIYSLGLAIFQLACGSLGDILGHRRIFLLGAAVFGVASAILGFLDSMTAFLGLRLAQGIGAAMTSASGLALLASCAPPEKRAAYLGFSGAAVYAGIACGPPAAGFITGSIGWRWIFWANALACLGVFLLMKLAASHEWRPAPEHKFDWQGCLAYSLAMSALVGGSIYLSKAPPLGWGCLCACAFFLFLFCRRERLCVFPMLNIGLLRRNLVFALSCLAAFVNYASFFGMIFYFSFYAQVGKGLSAAQTGLVLALQSVVQAICSPLAARLCGIWRQGPVSALGAGLCGLGLVGAAFIDLDSPLWTLFLAQTLLGAGISFFSLANTAIILESAGRGNIGQASGLTGAARTAGQLCSMVLITLSLGVFLGNEPVSMATMAGFMRSMRVNLFAFGILNLLAVGVALARNRL